MATTTTTNEESDIEKKKNKNPTGTLNWKDYFTDILSFFIKLLLVFIIGSRIVFACKVAQANLLPTNMNCMPYTNTQPIFETTEPEVNIDIMKIYDSGSKKYETFSTKLVFPIKDDTMNHFVLDKLRKVSQQHNTSRLTMYLVDILNNLFSFNFGAVSFILNSMNSMFSESVIIILGPILLQYLLLAGYFVNVILGIILFVVCAGRLFKYNSNNDSNSISDPASPPNWKPASSFSPGTILSVIAAFIISYGFVFFIPFIVFLTCIFQPFSKVAEIISTGDRKPYTFWDSVKGVLKTKLDLFMTLFCMNTTMATYKYVNVLAAFFVFIASIIFLYRNSYAKKTVPETATLGVTSSTQYTKTCSEPGETYNIEESIQSVPPVPPLAPIPTIESVPPIQSDVSVPTTELVPTTASVKSLPMIGNKQIINLPNTPPIENSINGTRQLGGGDNQMKKIFNQKMKKLSDTLKHRKM